MKHLDFALVDVFARKPYEGNQLAVVYLEGPLPSAEMQTIAREMNFSETTFLRRGEDGRNQVRIFTPTQELPFAGHPTLGTAHVIGREWGLSDPIFLDLPVGTVPVRCRDGLYWLEAPPVRAGNMHPPKAVLEIIGLEAEDAHGELPVQEVSAGIDFLLIPIRSLAALGRICIDMERRKRAIEKGINARMLFVFCEQARAPENQWSARMFFEHSGMREDPATGSANACLAGYLAEHRLPAGEAGMHYRLEQGVEMQRPSLIHVHIERREGNVEIRVGGGVFEVARGSLSARPSL